MSKLKLPVAFLVKMPGNRYIMARGKNVPGAIQDMIYEIRGHKVMLDSDLARLYEIESLRCQIGTSNEGKGGRRYLPFEKTISG